MDKIAPVQNERDFAREGNVLAEGSAKGVSRTLCLCLSLSLSHYLYPDTLSMAKIPNTV